MDLDEETEEIIRLNYRWWTVRAGKDFIKLGPLSITWYELDGFKCVQAIWLCRHVKTLYVRPA